MPKFCVQIDAKNFLAQLGSRLGKYGFITFRVVDAADSRAAEDLAIQTLREDEELRSMTKNEKDDPPVIDVLEIAEISDPNAAEIPSGRIWYEMNPRRWWQFWRK